LLLPLPMPKPASTALIYNAPLMARIVRMLVLNRFKVDSPLLLGYFLAAVAGRY
jgi:hypothetical protein